MQHQALLENYLRQLHLATFAQNYQTCAQDAARGNLPDVRYLLALCEAEVAQREAHRVERAIAAAKFPVLKELSTFDFDAVTNLSNPTVVSMRERRGFDAERGRSGPKLGESAAKQT